MQLTREEFHEWNSHGDGGVNLWELQQQWRQLPHHCHPHLIRTHVQSPNTCTGTLGHQTKLQCVHKLRLEINIISLLLLQLLYHEDTELALYPVRLTRQTFMMMMMIVDLYSALCRAPLYVSRCIVKRNVFSADWKDSMLSDGSRRWSGSRFQTIEPATENARRPNRLQRWRVQSANWSRSETLMTGDVWWRNAAVDQVLWRPAL